MDIVYASDQNYFPYTYISVKTLLENNKDVRELFVHYIHQEVPQKEQDMLLELGKKYGRNIEIRPFIMPPVYEQLPSYAQSKTTWAKFLFASLFPDKDRVLFVDPDTLILDNLEQLFFLEMGENLVGGVTECLPIYHHDASKMNDNEQYINGGVILCNLRKWRECGFEEKAMLRLTDMRLQLNYDQGVINEICSGKIQLLHPRYNVLAEVFEIRNAEKIKKRYKFKEYYTQEEISDALAKPAIIHFTGFLYGKPMSKYCTHPYAEYFRQQLLESPLEVSLGEEKLNLKQRIRRWMLDNTPFSMYSFFEDILDIRRAKLLVKEK